MKLKYVLVPVTVLSLAFSSTVLAKKYEDKGNPHHNDSDVRWENSNRPSDRFSQRGRDRAEERHYLKESKKHKEKNTRLEKKNIMMMTDMRDITMMTDMKGVRPPMKDNVTKKGIGTILSTSLLIVM